MTGTEIKTAREAAGIGLRALARRLKCSAQHLCDIEHDRRNPAHNLALRIAKLLELPAPTPIEDMVRTGKLPRRPTENEAVEIAQVLGMSTNERTSP